MSLYHGLLAILSIAPVTIVGQHQFMLWYTKKGSKRKRWQKGRGRVRPVQRIDLVRTWVLFSLVDSRCWSAKLAGARSWSKIPQGTKCLLEEMGRLLHLVRCGERLTKICFTNLPALDFEKQK